MPMVLFGKTCLRRPYGTTITGVERGAHGFGGSFHHGGRDITAAPELAQEILTERLGRLRKQNRKLDFEIHRQEEQVGDLEEMRRDVERANRVVMQSLRSMAGRIADQLSAMENPEEIKAFLLARLADIFKNLA